MTSTMEAPAVEATDESTVTESSAKRGRERDRDFTKVSQRHEKLAEYINANSGLDPISANVVKAVQLLAADYSHTDEAQAEREAAKAAKAEAEKQYAGLSEEDKKELRKAERAAAKYADAVATRERLLALSAEARESSPDEESSDSDSDAEAEAASGEVEPGRRGRRIGRK